MRAVRPGALVMLLILGVACVPRGPATAQPEGWPGCPPVALYAPPSSPALGGYDAGPGPRIGESQSMLIGYPSSCYPAFWRPAGRER